MTKEANLNAKSIIRADDSSIQRLDYVQDTKNLIHHLPSIDSHH